MFTLIFSLIFLAVFVVIAYVIFKVSDEDFGLTEWDDMDPIKIEPWLFDRHNRGDYHA